MSEWTRRTWSDAEWDDALRTHPEATFFHTRAWARIVTASFPACRDDSVWLERGGRAFQLPVFRWSRAGGWITTLHSSFPFLYGGPVPASDAAGDLLPEALAHLARGRVSARLTGNPFARPTANAKADPSGYEVTRDHTHTRALPESEDAYWTSLSTGKRNDYRRLARKGVQIEESRSPEDADRIYAHYVASFERWGGPPGFVHPASFYRNLIERGGDAVRLSVARFEGGIIGGAFVIRWNGRAHYLAGYFDHEMRALRPNVLIQIESIAAAARDGFREYDFLPSGGHEAVERFKEGMGGEAIEFDVHARRHPLHRWIDRMRGR